MTPACAAASRRRRRPSSPRFSSGSGVAWAAMADEERVEISGLTSEVSQLLRTALATQPHGDLALRHPDGRSLTIWFAGGRAFVVTEAETAADPAAAGDPGPVEFPLADGTVERRPREATVSYAQLQEIVADWPEERWPGVRWVQLGP